MRRKCWMFAITCLFLLGMVLPWMVSYAQDKWNVRNEISMELSLEEDDLLETMEIIGGKHKNVVMSTDIASKRTQQAIQEKVVKWLQCVSPKGIAQSMEEKMPVIPISVYARKFERNATGNMFWYCMTSDTTEIDTLIWIDEKTGLVVSFRAYADDLFPNMEGNTDTLVEHLLTFCQRYYPVDSVSLLERTTQQEEELCRLHFLQTDENGEQKEYIIPVRLQNGILYFNFYHFQEE